MSPPNGDSSDSDSKQQRSDDGQILGGLERRSLLKASGVAGLTAILGGTAQGSTADVTAVPSSGVGARLYANSTTRLTSESWTRINFDSRSYDKNGDGSISENEIVAPESGLYFCATGVEVDTPSDGTRVVSRISVNGSEKTRDIDHASSNGVDVMATAADVLSLSGGDSVTAEVWHNEGSSLNTDGSESKTFLTAVKLGSASGGSGDPVDIADSGTSVTTDANEIDFGTNLSVSDNGSNTVTVDATGSSTAADGTIIAAPGEVQERLDQAENAENWMEAPVTTVKLRTGTTYQPDSGDLPYKIRSNVRLECNGALIDPQADENVFELYRGSQLIDPYVNAKGIGFSSTAIVIGADDAGKLETANRGWVKDAYLKGDNGGNGVGIQFRGGQKPCSMQVATGYVDGFEYGVQCNATGGNGDGQGDWSNGNRWRGCLRNQRIPIHLTSSGAAVSGNMFWGQVQASESTEWIVYMEDDPRPDSQRGGSNDNEYVMRANQFYLYAWDTKQYLDNNYYDSSDNEPPIWYLGEGKRYGNAYVDMTGTCGNHHFVNRSDQQSRNGIMVNHGGKVFSADGRDGFFTEDTAFGVDASTRDYHEDS